MNHLKALRLAVIAIFLAVAGAMAFASPLARGNPGAALFAAALFLWGASMAINDVRTGMCRIITVPAGLKLDRILNTALIALRRQLLPLSAFSTAYRDLPLQGTDTIQVPFVPLQQAASVDFDQDNGYEDGDATLDVRPVVINKRKYQTLTFTSAQLARQPILELEQLIVAKANQLAEDVITDIFSAVTNAKFGAAAFTGAASSFDSDDVVDIRKVCNDAMWPKSGRSLVVNNLMDSYLFKDNDVKLAYAVGDNKTIRDGEIGRLLGFNYFDAPVLPDNGENLLGFAALPYALLIGFAPVQPAPEVLALMTDYRSVSDDNGLTLEYRAFGSPKGDKVTRIIECNYGYDKGDAAQLKRLVSA